MDDYTRQKLSEFIERTGQDMTVEEAKPAFEEKMETLEERAMEDLDHQTKVDYAVGMLNSEDLRESRIGGSGEKMDLKILSIGNRGVWDEHPSTEKPTLTAHGIIHGPIGDGGDMKAAKAVFLLTGDDIDLQDAQDKFHPLNELTGTFEVEEAWNLNGFYRVYSTDDTEIVETDLDDLPSARDEKNDLLRQMFPDVSLAELGEDGTGLSSFDPDSGFTHDWGVDIKRFRGTVVDYYINDDRTWGAYTLMDDSVTPEDIEGTKVVGEDQNIPGLNVPHCDPDRQMNYGNQSVVDVYGVMEVDDNGQIILRPVGIVPIIPMDMDDGDEADEGVQATESTI